MKTNNYFWGIAGLLVGVLAVNIFPSFAFFGMNSRYSNMMNNSKPAEYNQNNMMGGNGNLTGDLSRHFIEQMIPHHEDAIVMAGLAQKNGVHKEIKILAQAIISAQTSEINQMREWYQSWYGSSIPDSVVYSGHSMMDHQSGTMMGGMMGDQTDLEKLNTAQNFDNEFIRQMIPHHQMAIMMAQMVVIASDRNEIKELAQAIIRTQTDEINQMREWYQSWSTK